jgi:hypothetical protein
VLRPSADCVPDLYGEACIELADLGMMLKHGEAKGGRIRKGRKGGWGGGLIKSRMTDFPGLTLGYANQVVEVDCHVKMCTPYMKSVRAYAGICRTCRVEYIDAFQCSTYMYTCRYHSLGSWFNRSNRSNKSNRFDSEPLRPRRSHGIWAWPWHLHCHRRTRQASTSKYEGDFQDSAGCVALAAHAAIDLREQNGEMATSSSMSTPCGDFLYNHDTINDRFIRIPNTLRRRGSCPRYPMDLDRVDDDWRARATRGRPNMPRDSLPLGVHGVLRESARVLGEGDADILGR